MRGREGEGWRFGAEIARGRRGIGVGVGDAVRCGGLGVGGGRAAAIALVVCVLTRESVRENLLECTQVRREEDVRCEEV